MGTRLILVRHGRSAWNEAKRCQGSAIEPRLTRLGRRQAVTAGRQLRRAQVSPSAIYSSDQIRAVETAYIIRAALGEMPLYLDARLREMNQGVWEGMLYRDIRAEYGDLYRQFCESPFKATAPDGETAAQLVERTFEMMDSIATRHPNQTVLVVSHEFPLAVVACAAEGAPLTQVWDYSPGNCQWLTVGWPLGRRVAMPDAEQRHGLLWGLLGQQAIQVS